MLGACRRVFGERLDHAHHVVGTGGYLEDGVGVGERQSLAVGVLRA